jgi:hypothetical protein
MTYKCWPSVKVGRVVALSRNQGGDIYRRAELSIVLRGSTLYSALTLAVRRAHAQTWRATLLLLLLLGLGLLV